MSIIFKIICKSSIESKICKYNDNYFNRQTFLQHWDNDEAPKFGLLLPKSPSDALRMDLGNPTLSINSCVIFTQNIW